MIEYTFKVMINVLKVKKCLYFVLNCNLRNKHCDISGLACVVILSLTFLCEEIQGVEDPQVI
jgi:hypothetical protein